MADDCFFIIFHCLLHLPPVCWPHKMQNSMQPKTSINGQLDCFTENLLQLENCCQIPNIRWKKKLTDWFKWMWNWFWWLNITNCQLFLLFRNFCNFKCSLFMFMMCSVRFNEWYHSGAEQGTNYSVNSKSILKWREYVFVPHAIQKNQLRIKNCLVFNDRQV